MGKYSNASSREKRQDVACRADNVQCALVPTAADYKYKQTIRNHML